MFTKEFIAIDVETRNIDFDYDPIPIQDLKQLKLKTIMVELQNYKFNLGCLKDVMSY